MICDTCNKEKPKGLQIQDMRMCNTCVLALYDAGEIDIRDFMDAKRI